MAARGRAQWMVPELRKEREGCRLNLEELTNLLDGGEPLTEQRRKINKLIQDEPVFSTRQDHYLSTDEAYLRGMERSVHASRMCRDLQLDPMDKLLLMNATQQDSTLGLHLGAFLPTIEAQGTEEQKKQWVPLINDFKIIGAYTQTELGHGTNLQGLETTATYDPSTQEFVLNTPTLTATKWWSGIVGCSATHTLLMAKLITKGRDHGNHAFVVQLRSLEDHRPLPGVTVGDIGPKFGLSAFDNGFVRLDNVRIPRSQMLMKHAQVSPDGTYHQPPSKKMAYGTMVMLRAGIVRMTANALASAATIAVRYSAVRRQGVIESGKPEVQVLDYQTQQMKLLPLVATGYALTVTSTSLALQYMQCRADLAQGNLESLPEIHATTAGLKAFSAEQSTRGMEVCRLACGGHGYSRASGLPSLYANLSASVTYEGEATVLLLQTAKYLSKIYNQKRPASSLPPLVCYLGNDYQVQRFCRAVTTDDFLNPQILLELYRQRARKVVALAAKHTQRLLVSGASEAWAWNDSAVDWTNAAKAHCHYAVLNSFHASVEDASLCPENLCSMRMLVALYAVFGIIQNAGDFYLDNFMTARQVEVARQQLYSLLEKIRPDAVPLVDAFDIPDERLNSVLGRFDGNVYHHLYEWAKNSPRNKTEVHEAYHKHLKQLLKSKM